MMSFGLVTTLLTLLLARWPPASQQAVSPAGNGIETRRRFWRRLVGALFGLSAGLSGGLISWLIGSLIVALLYGLPWGLCGVAISLLLVHIPTTIVPTEILMWSWKRVWDSLKQREHTRVTLLLAPGLGLSLGLSYGLSTGLSAAGSYWFLLGLFQGISSITFREHQRTIPNQGIHRSGGNGLVLGIVAGAIATMIDSVSIFMSDGLSTGLFYILSYVLGYRLSVGDALGYVLSSGLRIH
jgi:hypothetical protein